MPLLKKITVDMLESIQKYCYENQKSFCVAMSCKADNREAEYDFFNRYLWLGGVILIENNQEKYSTYSAIDKSNVTVNNWSTAGVEGLSRGNKVLFFNSTEDNEYNLTPGYDEGVWSLCGKGFSYLEFSQRMRQIEQMSETEWRNLTSEWSNHFIYGKSKKLPQELIWDELVGQEHKE